MPRSWSYSYLLRLPLGISMTASTHSSLGACTSFCLSAIRIDSSLSTTGALPGSLCGDVLPAHSVAAMACLARPIMGHRPFQCTMRQALSLCDTISANTHCTKEQHTWQASL